VNSSWIDFLPLSVRRKLDGRSTLQQLIPNTGWLLFDKIFRLGVGLVVSVWVVRYLGPDQFGLLSFSIAFASLFSVLATFGLDGIVVRDLVNNPEQSNEILGSAFALKLVGAGGALLFALVFISLLKPGNSQLQLLVMISAAGMLFQSLDVVDFWFQSRVEAASAVYARSFAFVFTSALKLFLIVTKAPLVSFAFATSLELVLAAIGLACVFQVKGQHLLKWKSRMGRIQQLLRDGWPLALSSVAVIIYMKIDQVMLGEMLDTTAVGLYSAAVRISEVWYFIPTSIVASISPALIKAKDVSPALYNKRLGDLFRLMAGIALAIAIPMTFLSDRIVKLLYGAAYNGAGPILAVHIWAALFVFIGVAQSPWNILEGLTKLALVRTTLGAIANIVLNLLLIPKYGAMGAAIATTVSYALAAFVLNAFSIKTRKIFALQLASIIPIFPVDR
jgi:PST family polysaccharide transporter